VNTAATSLLARAACRHGTRAPRTGQSGFGQGRLADPDRLERVTHLELYQRYVYAGAISRNPDAQAELFTPDGVYEAPLVPDGHVLPRRLEGREAIRAGIPAYHAYPAFQRPVVVDRTRFTLHETTDPDVFVVETDAVLAGEGVETIFSLVQIFHLRDGLIRLLRDYFAVTD